MQRVCRTFSQLRRITPPPSFPNGFQKRVSQGLSRGSRFATGFNPLQYKPLDSIIDPLQAKLYSPQELVKIWDEVDYKMISYIILQYHLGRGHISASVDTKLYHLLDQRAMACQYFVIPVRRGDGYTSMFLQAKMPHLLFTGLEDYKARGTQSAPYFTVTYYKEFTESKGVVLVRGDVVFPSKLSDSEARWLLEAAQSFYMNDTRYKLVEQFNRETRDFEFKDVLRSLDMPTD